jgi:hypothetical protein
MIFLPTSSMFVPSLNFETKACDEAKLRVKPMSRNPSGDRIERDAEDDRRSFDGHVILGHVHLGGPVRVGALLRIAREVDPAELLERRVQRGGDSRAGHGGRRRLRVGEGDPVEERHEVALARRLALDGEADQVRLGLRHVEGDQARALAAPQLHRESALGVRVLEVAHESFPLL